MAQAEQRQEPRFRINQLIGYFPNREEYLWAEGINISAGGLRCRSKAAIDIDTKVYMMISVPEGEGERLVRCEGLVVHSHMEAGTCIFGVRFDNVEEEDRPHLEAYLALLAATPAAIESAPGAVTGAPTGEVPAAASGAPPEAATTNGASKP